MNATQIAHELRSLAFEAAQLGNQMHELATATANQYLPASSPEAPERPPRQARQARTRQPGKTAAPAR